MTPSPYRRIARASGVGRKGAPLFRYRGGEREPRDKRAHSPQTLMSWSRLSIGTARLFSTAARANRSRFGRSLVKCWGPSMLTLSTTVWA